MITAEQVRTLLRALEPQDIIVSGDVVSCKISGVDVIVSSLVLEEYLNIRRLLNGRKDTVMFIPGYYEQAVNIEGNATIRAAMLGGCDKVTLSHDKSGFLVEVSRVSPSFIIYQLDTDAMHDSRHVLLNVGIIFSRYNNRTNLIDIFSKEMSIKVFCPQGHAFFGDMRQLQAIAQASVYNLSYGYNLAFVLVESSEVSFGHSLARPKTEVQFPLRDYNKELVTYYQLAISVDNLILAYLTLYKIIEYFFTEVIEDIIYSGIINALVAPDFSHTNVNKLRDLVSIVRKFDQRMDERRALKNVLERYIDKEALRSWIEEFDRSNSNHFTAERELFKQLNRIDPSSNQIFATASLRIYHVRNALVHNKEGESSRFVPYSGQESLLEKEAQLLRYIAEELILKSSKDILL